LTVSGLVLADYDELFVLGEERVPTVEMTGDLRVTKVGNEVGNVRVEINGRVRRQEVAAFVGFSKVCGFDHGSFLIIC
jgi:hypothetical protein